MGDRRRSMGSGPGVWPTVPRCHAQQHRAHDQGGHREIPWQRHGEGHRSRLRQEAGEKFGEKIFDIIEQESGRLEDIDGMGPRRRTRIKEAWAEQKVIRNIMVFLHSNGVSTSRAVRIYKTYGEGAIDKVSRRRRLRFLFRPLAHTKSYGDYGCSADYDGSPTRVIVTVGE